MEIKVLQTYQTSSLSKTSFFVEIEKNLLYQNKLSFLSELLMTSGQPHNFWYISFKKQSLASEFLNNVKVAWFDSRNKLGDAASGFGFLFSNLKISEWHSHHYTWWMFWISIFVHKISIIGKMSSIIVFLQCSSGKAIWIGCVKTSPDIAWQRWQLA